MGLTVDVVWDSEGNYVGAPQPKCVHLERALNCRAPSKVLKSRTKVLDEVEIVIALENEA